MVQTGLHHVTPPQQKWSNAMPVSKRGNSWRATLCVNRIRDSATFDTRAQAEAWEVKRRSELAGGIRSPSGKTFSDLLDKYVEEVSIHKRGERWERIRAEAIKREAIGSVRLADLDTTHIVQWRNKRLKEVSANSVIREMTLIGHACEIARKEWQWLQVNPVRDVGRPKAGKHRTRTISDEEIEMICLALGFNGYQAVTAQQRTAVAFLFAIETAMRSGEICGLRKQDITGSVAHLPMTKNGSSRDVPLSPRALELLNLLPAVKSGPLFGLSDKVRDATFRLALSRTTIEDLHFHDTRRQATINLSKIFDVLELARITGHKDLKMLLVYYQTSAADLAGRL